MRTKVKADGDTIAAQLNVARGTLRKGITALGIAGNAYTHLVPRDKLQMGDAAIIASLMQGDHEVLRISMIIIKRNHSVLLQGHYCGKLLDQQSFAMSTSEVAKQIKNLISVIAVEHIRQAKCKA
jgi:ABC-type uncharacterized transport system ATPase subunit